jgi:hypothetical protein
MREKKKNTKRVPRVRNPTMVTGSEETQEGGKREGRGRKEGGKRRSQVGEVGRGRGRKHLPCWPPRPTAPYLGSSSPRARHKGQREGQPGPYLREGKQNERRQGEPKERERRRPQRNEIREVGKKDVIRKLRSFGLCIKIARVEKI